ncbi:MAG: carbohydrate binding domain-containing protein [Candidatus Symbiothrix sp.]|jgi:alpha-L-arabinofuranosidase|nr:carbohydrate binding domain-containing protein [Candidatus Symbiothrix sp.]
MKKKSIILAAILFSGVSLFAQVSLTVDAGKRGAAIGKNHYGIFFEEINHAGDGGLYAELVRNRSFEDNATSAESWSAVGSASLSLISENLLNSVQQHALRVSATSANSGVYNSGFWGMNIVAGTTYKFSCWMRAASAVSITITAKLQTASGVDCGSAVVTHNITAEWVKYETSITAIASAATGRLALVCDGVGVFDVDIVSLFPPTFRDRSNGCRIDLAEKLLAMKPGFVRFPGGCYVEGQYADGETNRFEWKKTIGAIESRPGHLNKNWDYRVSDGFGFHEMLQLTEDLGAEPLFVVNMGMGHGWVVNYLAIDEYIQEALDAIEYCNGDVSTTYGAMRAANGHPEPFNLRLIEIGNENYNYTSSNNNDQSDHYAERYAQFRSAILAKYPDMTLIGNVQAWSTDNPTWRNANPVDMVDEHYYRTPAWFVSNYQKYDTYSRSQHQIYVGEYAVTSNFGTTGNLHAALGEAIFMLGMENNSDVCVMNSYAPIFVNENDQKWKPDMIRFNASKSFGTPSYYVQQLFPNNVGTENVQRIENNNRQTNLEGKVGVGTWITAAKFENIRLTTDNNSIALNAGWTNTNGAWTLQSGTLTQTSTTAENCTAIYPTQFSGDYTYELTATKTGGSEGFLIIFNYQNDQNYLWWNIGGWSNATHGIEKCVGGSKTTIASAAGTITTGRAYAVKIEVSGTHVKCYLDGNLIHDVDIPVNQRIYTSANIDDHTGQLYVKIVNPNGEANNVAISINNASVSSAQLTVLKAASGEAENTLSAPNNVVPTESVLIVSDAHLLNYTAPPYSANILRLQVENVNIETEEETAIPQAVVKYSFENSQLADDSGSYPATLAGASKIVEMRDGNHAFYSGLTGGKGYLNLGTTMPKTVFANLTGDYSISIDLLTGEPNRLASFCWAYAFSNGTTKYLGLINASGNGNWYYEIKNSVAEKQQSNSGLSVGRWHNLTYVQQSDTGKIYLDGYLLSSGTVAAKPSQIAASLTEACLARSPFTADAYMENTCFDNFMIFDTAISAEQVAALCRQTYRLDNIASSTNIKPTLTTATKEKVDIYNLNGVLLQREVSETSALNRLPRGIYIVNRQKKIVN